MKKLFNELPLKNELIDNLKTLNYLDMTPIQHASLPLILEGHDVIAEAKTGSGKTAAFGLGLLNKINVEDLKLNSLVICPTRELAEQVAEELRRLARQIKNMKILVICGGGPEYFQLNSIEHGVHIIVGTPGRLLKYLKNDSLNIQNINTLVLDEADRMLDMGFFEDIKSIISYSSKKRQTLLFSATFPDEIEFLSQEFQNNPQRIRIDVQHAQNVIKQVFVEVPTHQHKLECLMKILGNYKPESTIIFCKTKQICADVADYLKRQKIEALPFHGDLDQNERTVVLTKFENKSSLILVATDVAARGLDISDLKAVINFDMAIDPEVYTHRIGRSGRAGNVGLAFSLFIKKEIEKINEIENYLNNKGEFLKLEHMSDDVHFDLKAPMQTLYISGGKKDKIRPGDILGAILGETGIDPALVGNINILPNQSYVAIKSTEIKNVISKLNNGKIKGRKYKVGLA